MCAPKGIGRSQCAGHEGFAIYTSERERDVFTILIYKRAANKRRKLSATL